jgi:hypothetical protein
LKITLLLIVALAAPALALAQNQPGCAALCAVSCAKPISIPDRWDDVTPIPGYTGALSKQPNWRNNGRYDSESFVDTNANALWDPGESYTDGNANGAYDREAFDPATTGYNAGPSLFAPGGDVGSVFTLTPTSATAPSPGQYFAIDYPPSNRGVPIAGGDEYRNNWASCAAGLVGAGDLCQIEPFSLVGPTNQAMRDVIAQDPDAYWDPVTASVQGSAFSRSPRIIFFPIHDPRIPFTSSTSRLLITKVAAFFMEQMTGNAMVQGRFMRALGTGESCAVPGDGFVVECPTPARGTSWGRVKDHYR